MSTSRYHESKENREERDLFICHATEDKDVVRPLVDALVEAGYSLWYDEFALKLGNHVRRAIEKGLAISRYGLVVLSPNFFAKEWTQKELDGLVAKEHNGQKVVLPVWHNVDADYIRKKSLILSDVYAVSTKQGITNIVQEVLKVVTPSKFRKARVHAPKKTLKRSTRIELERTIFFLRGGINRNIIPQFVKEMEFERLREMFFDVLDGVAFFELEGADFNIGIFEFMSAAILERNRTEGAELLEKLLTWYFQTVTPSCKEVMLKTFAHLTRLSHLKEVVARTNLASSFVAEFGLSDSYEIAAINAEILMNIQRFLSDTDLVKVVDSALTNDQIFQSWEAKRYLTKILALCEGRVDKRKIEELTYLLNQ